MQFKNTLLDNTHSVYYLKWCTALIFNNDTNYSQWTFQWWNIKKVRDIMRLKNLYLVYINLHLSSFTPDSIAQNVYNKCM